MLFMNTYDIDEAAERYQNNPVLGPATKNLQNFRDTVDDNSDGWAYWKLAPKAAEKLMQLIQAKHGGQSLEEMKLALKPIIRFCKRHKLPFEPVLILSPPVTVHEGSHGHSPLPEAEQPMLPSFHFFNYMTESESTPLVKILDKLSQKDRLAVYRIIEQVVSKITPKRKLESWKDV